MLVRSDAHHVHLCRTRVVLLQREESDLTHGDGLEVPNVPNVCRRRLLDPEPLRQCAQHALADARPLVGIGDLLDAVAAQSWSAGGCANSVRTTLSAESSSSLRACSRKAVIAWRAYSIDSFTSSCAPRNAPSSA